MSKTSELQFIETDAGQIQDFISRQRSAMLAEKCSTLWESLPECIGSRQCRQ